MRPLIPPVMIIASLALSGNAFAAAAQAASHVKTSTTTAHAAQARVAGHGVAKHVVAKNGAPRRAYALARRPADLGQFFQSLFGGGWPGRVSRQASHGSPGASDWTPTFDNWSTVDTSSAFNDAQAAADTAAELQAIQSMNDTNALTASMAAAEAQNDAANAATLQTEINAGM